MKTLFENAVYSGVIISLVSYGLGTVLKKRFRSALFNPVLISVALIIVFLAVFDINYDSYSRGAGFISWMLTPATICLAVPMYEQFELLKKNSGAVMAGIASGVITSLLCILLMALLFNLDHVSYVTFLPKSITTAIGMGVSEELGGRVSLTVGIIIITGVMGNMFSEMICRIFRIKDPVAKGIAIGSASHVIGTSRAMEIGEIEGAMSSLSTVVSGLVTVAGAAVFAGFM